MQGWKTITTESFSIQAPENWLADTRTNGELVLHDPSSSIAMVLKLREAPADAPARIAGFSDDVTPEEARTALRGLVKQFPEVRLSQPVKQVPGTAHMTCTTEGIISRGVLRKLLRRPQRLVDYRFWATLSQCRAVLISSHGGIEEMQFFRAVQDAIVASLRIATAAIGGQRPFIQMVVDLAREHLPPEQVSALDADTLNVGGVKIKVVSLREDYLKRPDKLAESVKDFFEKLLVRHPGDTSPAADWDEISLRVLPVIMPTTLAERLEGDVVKEEWLSGLTIFYEAPGRTAPITHTDLGLWEIDQETLHQHALENLLRATRNMSMTGGKYGQYTMFNFSGADANNAARILLPIVYKNLRQHLGNTFFIAIPDRASLTAFCTEDAATLNWLRRQVEVKFSQATHPLSDKLFLATPDGIAEVEIETAAQTAGE